MDQTSQSSLKVHPCDDQKPIDLDAEPSNKHEILSNDFSLKSCLSPDSGSKILDPTLDQKPEKPIISELRKTRGMQDGYHVNEEARKDRAFHLRFSDSDSNNNSDDDSESDYDTTCVTVNNIDMKEAPDHLGNLEELKLRYQRENSEKIFGQSEHFSINKSKSKTKTQHLVERLKNRSNKQNDKKGFMDKILNMYGANEADVQKSSLSKNVSEINSKPRKRFSVVSSGGHSGNSQQQRFSTLSRISTMSSHDRSRGSIT